MRYAWHLFLAWKGEYGPYVQYYVITREMHALYGYLLSEKRWM